MKIALSALLLTDVINNVTCVCVCLCLSMRVSMRTKKSVQQTAKCRSLPRLCRMHLQSEKIIGIIKAVESRRKRVVSGVA